jgi:hypothetical protein
MVLHYLYNIQTGSMGAYQESLVVSGVIETADHQKSRFRNQISLKYKATCKKALTRGPEAQMELFDEKKQEV